MKVRPIPGFPGYFIAATGHVFSRQRSVNLRPLKWCKHSNGYAAVNLRDAQGKHRYVKVHQLVMLTWVGSCPDGHCVNHKDGDKWNPDITNLEYVTHKENLAHALGTKLRIPCHGESHHWSKLTAPIVQEIKQALGRGKTQTDLAKKFNVNASCISDIATGKTWRHV